MHRRAFSLMELLIALAIFLVGMIAVASVIPAAARLQKATLNDALMQHARRSVEGIVSGAPISQADLLTASAVLPPNVSPNDYRRVHPILPVVPHWSSHDRSFPSVETDLDARFLHWVPLARSRVVAPSDPDHWQLFVFLLRAVPGAVYDKTGGLTFANASGAGAGVPGVAAIAIDAWSGSRFDFDNRHFAATPSGEADQVRAGDRILDDNGVIYVVADADAGGATVRSAILAAPQPPTTLWYGRPPEAGVEGPTLDVLLLAGAVAP